ncbi:MAG: flagellar brake protein [Betaproteobacteria bacterium]
MKDSQQQAKNGATETTILLEQAHLKMGDTVLLQAPADAAVERYSVRLIGMSRGESVLVSTPMLDGKWLFLREGKPFVLRAFSGKYAYAFSTKLLMSVNTPYPYLHLAYPREIRSLTVRENVRCVVNIPCATTSCDGAALQGTGTIVDLSVGGALMTTGKPPGEVGKRVVIKFNVVVNRNEAMVELNAEIRTVTADETGDLFKIGLQFDAVDAKNLLPMQAYIYHELLGQSSAR